MSDCEGCGAHPLQNCDCVFRDGKYRPPLRMPSVEERLSAIEAKLGEICEKVAPSSWAEALELMKTMIDDNAYGDHATAYKHYRDKFSKILRRKIGSSRQ